MKKYLFSMIFFIISLLSLSSSASKFAAAPAGVYQSGIGIIYGVAVSGKNLIGDHVNVLAGKTFGKVKGYGIHVNQIPLFFKDLSLNFTTFDADKFEYETTYARGLKEKTVFRQRFLGNGNFFGFKYKALSGRLVFNLSLGSTYVKFKEFMTKDGRTIPFSKAGLHDINSDLKTYAISYAILNEENENELSVKLSLNSVKGRLAQSELLISNYSLKGMYRFSPKFSLGYYSSHSKTKVTKELASAVISGNCSTISDSSLQSSCTQINNELNDYIVANNKYGTTMPLGGSSKMRSYREFRFKSAHNLMSAIEARLDSKIILPVQYIGFSEIGFASDIYDKLLDDSRYSVGLGLRIFIKEIPIRLEVATGQEGESAYLTLGAPW